MIQHAAEAVLETLRPHVSRAVIAGSIRRGKADPKDIEIVAEPMMNHDLFGDTASPVLDPVLATLDRVGKTVKGGPRYRQIVLRRGGWTVDLFLVHPPSQWGTQLAIRTGPAELSHVAVANLRKRGMRCVNGRILHDRRRETLDTPGESEFFAFAGLPFVEPRHRDLLAQHIRAGKYRPAIEKPTPDPFVVEGVV